MVGLTYSGRNRRTPSLVHCVPDCTSSEAVSSSDLGRTGSWSFVTVDARGLGSIDGSYAASHAAHASPAAFTYAPLHFITPLQVSSGDAATYRAFAPCGWSRPTPVLLSWLF